MDDERLDINALNMYNPEPAMVEGQQSFTSFDTFPHIDLIQSMKPYWSPYTA